VHLTDAGQRLLAEAIAPAIRPPQAA
jgi:lysophospholipase L1-like esterase